MSNRGAVHRRAAGVVATLGLVGLAAGLATAGTFHGALRGPTVAGATGWFDPAPQHLLDVALGIALGDLDGDGDPDLYSTYYNRELLWRNENGSFVGPFFPPFDDDVRSVALGDLDGDGDLDAFVGGGEETGAGDAARVRFNQGNLQFVDSGQELGDAETASVALGDVDGDGDLDALTLELGGSNRLWVNQGHAQGGSEGVFADGGQAFGAGTRGSVAFGDLDGDGDLDAVAPDGGLARIFVNLGGGLFNASGMTLGATPGAAFVALGDLDGDGDLDAWVSTDEAETVWLNETPPGGPLAFADSGQRLGMDRRESRGVALGDLDNDGDLDAVVGRLPLSAGGFLADVPQVALTVWRNDASGGFTLSGQCIAPAADGKGSPLVGHAAYPVLADVNGDEDLDLTASTTVPGTTAFGIRVWRNGAMAGTGSCCPVEEAIYGGDWGVGALGRRPSSLLDRAARGGRPGSAAGGGGRLLAALGAAAARLAGAMLPIDVGTYFEVRDALLPGSQNGQRYLDFYSVHGDELVSLLVADPTLLLDGAESLGLWDDPLQALLDGQGATAVITQEQIDAVDGFLADVAAAGSATLADAIAAELDAIPPLQELVGQTMEEAREETVGPPLGEEIFTDGFESGDTAAWTSTVQ